MPVGTCIQGSSLTGQRDILYNGPVNTWGNATLHETGFNGTCDGPLYNLEPAYTLADGVSNCLDAAERAGIDISSVTALPLASLIPGGPYGHLDLCFEF